MASSSSSASTFAAFLSSWLLLLVMTTTMVSPAHTQNCTSQKFTNSNLFTNCTALPSLNSYLHYSYNSSNSSLSIAFIAQPSKSDGWTAWGINPNATGMAGTQAFVAFKSSSAAASLSVKTYNVISYRDINETSKLSFDFWDLKAESLADGNHVIFASLKVPTGKEEKLNQVWQVGPSVTNGRPDKHEFNPVNLAAKANLDLAAATLSSAGSGANSTSNSTNAGASGNSTSAAGYMVRGLNGGFYFGMGVVAATLLFWPLPNLNLLI